MASSSGETEAKVPPVKKYELEAKNELRIEVEEDSFVSLSLLRGTAEVAGTELAKARPYKIAGGSTAIFSWHGCTLEIKGHIKVAYTSAETPYTEYANLHSSLEVLRGFAASNNSAGPRVMVVGGADSGNSTLCRVLLSYAVRSGRRPLFVDLDVRHNDITIPATVAACPVLHPIDIEHGIRFRVPITYFYGHCEAVENKDHYETCITQLAASSKKRLEQHPDENASGIIINTIGWIDGEGYNLILKAAELFGVSILIVNGHDRLHAQLSQEDRLQGVKVARVTKSGGVVVKDAKARRKGRYRRIRQYFYGPTLDLSPHKTVLHFSDVGVFEVGGMPQAPSSALPIGEQRLLEPNRVVPVHPTSEFLHSVLAVSQAKSPDDLLTAPIAGFLYVSAVDTKRRTLTVLTPCSGPLPANCMLHGSLKWFD